MNSFDLDEFHKLKEKYNPNAWIREEIIEYQRRSYFDRMKYSVLNDRKGEVVFIVLRPNGKTIAVTSEEYPEGIFRIPTGGISYGENIEESVHREVREELGLQVSIKDFIGVFKICFKHQNDRVPFYSYVFAAAEVGGNLLEDASDDEVSGVREADAKTIDIMARELISLKYDWNDWGRFRFLTTKAASEYMESRGL